MHTFPESTIIGTRILYMLSEHDVKEIVGERIRAGRATAHGNDPREGDVVAGVIVAAFGEHTANLHLFLDGNDSFWPTSRGEFDPATCGKRYTVVNGERLTDREASELAGPNDVGAGEAAAVEHEWVPDARGRWIRA